VGRGPGCGEGDGPRLLGDVVRGSGGAEGSELDDDDDSSAVGLNHPGPSSNPIFLSSAAFLFGDLGLLAALRFVVLLLSSIFSAAIGGGMFVLLFHAAICSTSGSASPDAITCCCRLLMMLFCSRIRLIGDNALLARISSSSHLDSTLILVGLALGGGRGEDEGLDSPRLRGLLLGLPPAVPPLIRRDLMS